MHYSDFIILLKNDKENAFKNIDQALALPDVGEDVQVSIAC